MVTRVHRNTTGIDYSPTVIDLGPVKLSIESGNVAQGIDLVTTRLEDDSAVMRDIADRMVLFVQENIRTGQFTPLLPETIERRKYAWSPSKGYGARPATGGGQPLVASGALVSGIQPRSKAGYAAAQRGDEWYGFLHDRGIGRLDRRTFMELKAGHVEEIYAIYDEWFGGVVEDVN